MELTLNEVRDLLSAEKRFSTYDDLEERYNLNRYYLHKIINDEDYHPSARARRRLGMALYIDGIYLPSTTKELVCPTCGRSFFRTSNRMIYCRKECR